MNLTFISIYFKTFQIDKILNDTKDSKSKIGLKIENQSLNKNLDLKLKK